MAEVQDEHISLRLGRDTTVTLMFEGPITQEGITRLMNHLELMKDSYPTSAELRVEGVSTWHKPNAS